MNNEGRYLVNQQNCYELTNQIKLMINGANTYIKICSFLMQDKEIVDLLIKKSLSGIAIFVLSNLNEKKSDEYLSSSQVNTTKDIDDRDFGINNHQLLLQKLYYNGIHVRSLIDLHAKFLITDGMNALLMSANIAPNSLKKNVETGITLNEMDAHELEYVFDVMYQYADILKYVEAKYKDIITKSHKVIPEETFNILKSKLRITACSNGKQKSETNLVALHKTSIYDEIISIINHAQKYVYLVSWQFKALENLPELKKSLSQALKRNVKIFFYCNRTGNDFGVEKQKQFLLKVLQMGCKVYSDTCNHSKCVINEKEGILFTANIDGYAGMTTGFEVGCVFDVQQLTAATTHVKNLIKNGIEYGNKE